MRTSKERRQRWFDTVTRHLLSQKEKSLFKEEDDSCAYRGLDGKKCAIGCLIPDSKYEPSMEGFHATNPRILWYLSEEDEPESISGTDVCFLGELQGIHDNLKPCEWWFGLDRLVSVYGLNPKALHEFITEGTKDEL